MATPAVRLSLREAFRTERAAATPQPPRTPYTVRAARWLARRLPAWAAIRTLLLSVAGFGSLTVAAFHWHVIAGWVALGVSFLTLEALSGGERR